MAVAVFACFHAGGVARRMASVRRGVAAVEEPVEELFLEPFVFRLAPETRFGHGAECAVLGERAKSFILFG